MKLTNFSKNDEPLPLPEIDFQRVTQDSREVEKGDLFIAISCDGVLDHIISALKKGAVAIVVDEIIYQQNQTRLPHAPYIIVKNSRKALSEYARQLYPEQPNVIAAVTGTNGKSSVVAFIRQLWQGLGVKGASFGTLGLESTPKVQEEITSTDLPKLTTPDALSLHKLLEFLVKKKVDHFAFEASSHGLSQYRLHGAHVRVAGFTNLTPDHLDYHSTMEDYFEAKSK